MLRQKAQEVAARRIAGIFEEANDVAGEVADKSVLEAALIAVAQAVELRNGALRHFDRVGKAARQAGLRDPAATDFRRGKGDRSEADRYG